MQEGRDRIGVLLGQVGTPGAPTKKALLPYLKNFLSDPRVMDLNPLIWRPILHGVVLRRRPARSAQLYKEIWMNEGSPLLVYSKMQARALQERLGDTYMVELGMAYGGPSIREAVARIERVGITRIILLPLFPQFSTTTTASVFDETYSAVSGRRWNRRRIKKKFIPALHFMGPYYDHPDYIAALAARTKRELKKLSRRPDMFVITFHGIPKRYAEEGDPYPAHCKITAQLLARAMNWKDGEWRLSFQSRFGREEWLGPYTSEILGSLPALGIERPCVLAPSFVTDCLETLHELGIEGKRVFVDAGGDPDSFALIPSLNDDPEWIDFLATLIRKNS